MLVWDSTVNPSWNITGSMTVKGFVIYNDTTSPKYILCSGDTGTLTPSDGTISITWADPGEGGICSLGLAF